MRRYSTPSTRVLITWCDVGVNKLVVWVPLIQLTMYVVENAKALQTRLSWVLILFVWVANVNEFVCLTLFARKGCLRADECGTAASQVYNVKWRDEDWYQVWRLIPRRTDGAWRQKQAANTKSIAESSPYESVKQINGICFKAQPNQLQHVLPYAKLKLDQSMLSSYAQAIPSSCYVGIGVDFWRNKFLFMSLQAFFLYFSYFLLLCVQYSFARLRYVYPLKFCAKVECLEFCTLNLKPNQPWKALLTHFRSMFFLFLSKSPSLWVYSPQNVFWR